MTLAGIDGVEKFIDVILGVDVKKKMSKTGDLSYLCCQDRKWGNDFPRGPPFPHKPSVTLVRTPAGPTGHRHKALMLVNIKSDLRSLSLAFFFKQGFSA